MTNLDSVLESRDITLLTKVCLAKAMVFPGVMYGCESWTVKKAECQRIDGYLQTLVLEKTPESPLESKEIKPVNFKGYQPWIFPGRTYAEAEAPIFWYSDAKRWLIGKVPGFSGGSDGKESDCSAGDLGLIPGSGRSPGEGNGNPLQYPCLEKPMDGGAWQATVHGLAQSQTQLSNFTFTFWCWKRLRAEGEEGVRGWGGWMASPMQQTWTWTKSRRW